MTRLSRPKSALSRPRLALGGYQLSKETRTRLEGLKQLGTTATRQIPPIDKLYDTKDGYEGIYKLLKGKKPPSLGHGLKESRSEGSEPWIIVSSGWVEESANGPVTAKPRETVWVRKFVETDYWIFAFSSLLSVRNSWRTYFSIAFPSLDA